jgi:bifunctional ADP-heptose synthase (sugar kinase/adenylyltransferase)
LPTKVADLLRIGHLNLLDRLRVLGDALILANATA